MSIVKTQQIVQVFRAFTLKWLLTIISGLIRIEIEVIVNSIFINLKKVSKLLDGHQSFCIY